MCFFPYFSFHSLTHKSSFRSIQRTRHPTLTSLSPLTTTMKSLLSMTSAVTHPLTPALLLLLLILPLPLTIWLLPRPGLIFSLLLIRMRVTMGTVTATRDSTGLRSDSLSPTYTITYTPTHTRPLLLPPTPLLLLLPIMMRRLTVLPREGKESMKIMRLISLLPRLLFHRHLEVRSHSRVPIPVLLGSLALLRRRSLSPLSIQVQDESGCERKRERKRKENFVGEMYQ